MEQKNIIIICVSLIIIVLIVCGSFIYLNSIKDTSLSLEEDSITKGDNLTFKLVDSNGNALVNKSLTVNITSSNNINKSYNLTTNEKGIAKLKINFSKGNYLVNAVFKGELFLKSSTLSKELTINEESSTPSSSSKSTSSLVKSEFGYYEETDYSKRYDMDDYIYDVNGTKMYWVKYDGYDGSYRHLGE